MIEQIKQIKKIAVLKTTKILTWTIYLLGGKVMSPTFHITMPIEQACLLEGIPLILPGWDDGEMDAEIAVGTWAQTPKALREKIRKAAIWMEGA